MPLAMEFEWVFFRLLFGAKRQCRRFHDCGEEMRIPPHTWRIISRAASAAPAASFWSATLPQPGRFRVVTRAESANVTGRTPSTVCRVYVQVRVIIHSRSMALTPGTKIGPFEILILAPLGAGGMGEVYRARDTRLDRTVAIKILSSHLSSSPEAKQRFEREACHFLTEPPQHLHLV
jgi:hypothetical protein